MRNTGIQVRLFNSHPHKEDDKENQAILFYNCFSTHILTRRMTLQPKDDIDKIRFSTHILTRRMTVFTTKEKCIEWIFQLTSSQGG